MRSVGRKDTAPEIAVRRQLHASGLRYRLHVKELPGTPDIVLPRHSSVIFVHGCFWHGHCCPHGSIKSKTNSDYWERKIADNRRRDAKKRRHLRRLGWFVETVWECRVNDIGHVNKLVRRLLAR